MEVKIKVKMPGHIRSYGVEVGKTVRRKEIIAMMEALRMEHQITSPVDGTVTEILVPVNQRISAGTCIMIIRSFRTDEVSNDEKYH